MKRKILLFLIAMGSLWAQAQYFQPNAITSGYASHSTPNYSIQQTYGQLFANNYMLDSIQITEGFLQSKVNVYFNVDFMADELYGGSPFTVNFTDSTELDTGPIKEWLWYFGDGDSSSVQNPVHIYENNGTTLESFTVTLLVTDSRDSVNVMIKEDYIKVCPQNYNPGGNVNGTWTKENSPYFIGGEIIVPYGDTLTIEPGVNVKFRTNSEDISNMSDPPTPYNTDYGYMTVYGTLIAQGTENDSIFFTRVGNTGSWGLLHMTKEANPDNALEYLKMDFASFMNPDTANLSKEIAGLNFDGMDATVMNSSFSNNYTGISCDSSNATIDNNYISGNNLGICLSYSNAEIIYNMIQANLTHGILCNYDSSFISNNQILDNVEAGIYSDQPGSLTISGNNISGSNRGIGCKYSEVQIDNNMISSNYDGILCVHSDLHIYNNIISSNTGNGIMIEYTDSYVKAVNNTIIGNGYGVYCGNEEAFLTIVNSILWENTTGSSFNDFPTITWSCIEGGYPGEGNIDLDPIFVGTKDGAYDLSWINFPVIDETKSPCIDSGDLDPNGNGIDWWTDPDDRDPDRSRMDMGAHYYYQTPMATVYNDPDTLSGEYKFFNFGEWQIPETSTPKNFHIQNETACFNDWSVYFEGVGADQFNLVNQADTLLYLKPLELDSVDVVFQPTAVGSQNAYLTICDTTQYTDSLWVRGTGLGTGTVNGYVKTPSGEGVQGVTLTVEAEQHPWASFTATTMPDGSYVVTNVGYGFFSVTPEMIQDSIAHDFNPVSYPNVELASTFPVTKNFTDVSFFDVNGNISYLNTTCPSAGIQIYLDDLPAVNTDESGNFTIEDVPIGSHTFRPDTNGGHYFDPPIIFDTIWNHLAGMNFKDEFTNNLSGYVTGGCYTPLAESIEVTISCTDVCGPQDMLFHTDSAGYFSINLPPHVYNVAVNDFGYYGNPVHFDPVQVDLLNDSVQQDFVYHSKPVIELTWLNDSMTYFDGIAVLEQFQPYHMQIEIYEPYGEIKCMVDTGIVVVLDDISEVGQVDLPITDSTFYSFYAGMPNIASGGDHGYQKLMSFNYVYDQSKDFIDEEEWVYVTGHRPRETAFITTTPEIPLLILRDPPGDKSYSYMNETTEISQSVSIGVKRDSAQGAWAKVHLGVDFDISAGGGFWSISTGTESTCDFGGGMSVVWNQNSIDEIQMTWRTTEEFRTSEDPWIVGDKGDLYMGGAMNLFYGITDVLYIKNDSIKLIQDIIVAQNGFATTYIYTEYYIENTLIPSLYLTGYTTDAQRWEEHLAYNDTLKLNAPQQDSINYSFSGGVGYDYSKTVEKDSTHTYEFETITNYDWAADVGLTVGGIGITGGIFNTFQLIEGKSTVNSTVNSNTVGYHLEDDDPLDGFTVDVKNDPVYGTAVFDLVSGQSKCPYEENTVPRQGCQLNPHVLNLYEVPADEPAIFTLNLTNTSQTEETWAYELSLLNQTNPKGAIVTAGGANLGAGPVSYELEYNNTLPVNIQITRPPGDSYVFEGLTLELASPCEIERAGVLGINPVLADWAEFNVYFIAPCSYVSISNPGNNWVVNSNDNNTLSVTIMDYDTTNQALQYVKLEYSPDGSTWIEIFSIPKQEITQNYLVFNWDVSSYSDGTYLIRAVSECSGSQEAYSDVLTGEIERSLPVISGYPEPADGILNAGDEISFTFNEALKPSTVTLFNCKLLNAENGEQLPVNISYQQAEQKIYFTIQSSYNYFIENHTLETRVEGVTDMYGNALAEPATNQFWVDVGPLHWSVTDFTLYDEDGADITFTSNLNNSSGNTVYYNIWTADWLSALPDKGYLDPGKGTIEVNFTADTLETGIYSDTIKGSTLGFADENIRVNIVVGDVAPQFILQPISQAANPGDTVKFITRALGHPSPSYSWRKNGDLITFETDSVLVIENVTPADAGNYQCFAGSASSEIATLSLGGGHLTQTINLPGGWSGLSSYLMPAVTDIQTLYSNILDELVIALTEEEIFYPAYNINTIGNWEQHSAYKVKTNSGVSLNIVGEMEEDLTLPLVDGWNLIPVVSACAVDVESIFSPVVADLEIVKEVAGWGVYWPGMGINTLGTLNPGEAYYVLMMGADKSIVFEECLKNSVVASKFNFEPNPAWNEIAKTPDNHVIGMTEKALADFEAGDYIGVFTKDGASAGQIIVDATKQQTVLIAFGKDAYASQQQGFETGEAFIFKLYETRTGDEYELIPEFDLSQPGGGALFTENGISVITSFKVSETGMSGGLSSDIIIYPNPTTGRFTVQGADDDALINIFDLQGQIIQSEISHSKQGCELNLTERQPGIYIVQILSNGQYVYKKLVLD